MKKQKKQPILKQYDNDTFPITLWVICSKDANSTEESLNKKLKHRDDSDLYFSVDKEYHYAITWENVWDPKSTYRGVVIWIQPNITAAQAAHEAIHALHQFMLDTGLEFNDDEGAGNEHIAYLVQWIVECIMLTAKCKK